MSEDKVPKVQRALVLQGGGALGAYDTGVFQALYEKINTGSDGRWISFSYSMCSYGYNRHIGIF
ncbi:MAG TPA: hypothetical protein VE089_01435 [Nitrososphaeraceae archaeon]|nr:hypothetical protein [Nitrososphaeraceae archaeon]